MMNSIETPLLCQQCAAPLPVEQGTQFITCEYCNTTNFVDKSGVVLHMAVKPTLSEEEAQSSLRRWMGGNQTIKNLDKKSTITLSEFHMFPMWLLRTRQGDAENVYLEPAAALSIIEFKEMTVSAGALEAYDHEQDAYATDPTVPLATVKRWLAENQGIAASTIQETTLVHLPAYSFKYTVNGRLYTAVVDAASGQVFASIFPAKLETPYRTIAGLGCLGYFIAAFIPLLGYLFGDIAGLGGAIVVYLVLSVIVAIPLFAVAAYISSRY